MLNFIISNSTNQKKENIYVVASDGFVDQDTVSEEFKMPNAIYMSYQWHLFDSILPKRFERLVSQTIGNFF